MKTQLLIVTKLTVLLNLLLFTTPAISAYKAPPEQKQPSDYTRSGGSRGCPGEEQIPLTILSPTGHIGQIVSRRPTFAWFLNNSYETVFRLFEFEPNGKPKQIGEPIKLQASKGINKFSLPENYPELTIGKKYLWQVSISCPDMPRMALLQRAEFIVVEIPSELKNKLTVIDNNEQKANLYAEQGLWYDAFESALKLSPEGKLGKVGSTLVLSLAFSEQKSASNQQELQQRVENLNAIVKLEK